MYAFYPAISDGLITGIVFFPTNLASLQKKGAELSHVDAGSGNENCMHAGYWQLALMNYLISQFIAIL